MKIVDQMQTKKYTKIYVGKYKGSFVKLTGATRYDKDSSKRPTPKKQTIDI